MKLVIATCLCFGLIFSFTFGQEKGGGLTKGTIFAGVSPCLSFSSNGDPESESGSNNNSIGAHLNLDYFVADNLSVGASIGGSRNASNFNGGFSDSRFTNSHFDAEVGVNFYPPNCFCDGEPNDSRFRPFFGVNAGVQRGRRKSTFDNLETITGFQNLNVGLNAGVLVNLKENTFMGVEGNVLGITASRDFNPDSGTVVGRNNSVNTMVNKSLMSVNFLRQF